MAGVWTPEAVENIRSLALAGMSATQIAVQLGNGITRNMVCGIAFRSKFHFLGTGGGSNRRSAKPRNLAIKSDIQTKPRKTYLKCLEVHHEVPPVRNVTLMELEPWMCKWPIGDPRRDDFRYCGGKRHEDYPYCSNCCMLAYESPENRNAELQRETGQSAGARNQIRHWRTFPNGF